MASQPGAISRETRRQRGQRGATPQGRQGATPQGYHRGATTRRDARKLRSDVRRHQMMISSAAHTHAHARAHTHTERERERESERERERERGHLIGENVHNVSCAYVHAFTTELEKAGCGVLFAMVGLCTLCIYICTTCIYTW